MSSLNLLLSGTILPWLLGLLLVFATLALLLSIKLWRATKRSPYFFMRQQAAKKMQSYLTVFAVLMLMAAGIGTYGWRSPSDTTIRMALITRAKPATAEIQEMMGGIRLSMGRVKCALLSLNAMKQGLKEAGRLG